MSKKLVIASGNSHKVDEISSMIRAQVGSDISVHGMHEFGAAPEIVESADSFRGNAMLKAKGIAQWLGCLGVLEPTDWVLADDSGLCVDVLSGRPGVYSARFAGEKAGDADNNAALVTALREQGVESSPAHYECVLAMRSLSGEKLVISDAFTSDSHVELCDEMVLVEGRCHGKIRIETRGDGGFGYDPHFWIDGGRCTFAELTMQEKAKLSHRGNAFKHWLNSLPSLM